MKLSEEKAQQIARLRAGHDRLSAPAEAPRKDYRIDGYQNLLNKYGTPQDNTEAYTYTPEGVIPDMELTRQYESNGLFAKIIDTPAEEVVKHGFELGLDDESVEQSIKDTLDDLDFEEKASTAIKWARLYGGSIIVMMINDGKGLDEPVDWKKVRSIDELRVFERAIVQPDYHSLYENYGEVFTEHTRSRFGQPQYFSVFSITGYFRVHESRCLIFRNGTMPEQGMVQDYRFWGIPEYMRIKRQLRETITAHGDSVKLLERSVQAIYKMKNLAQLLATDEGENQALKRLEIIDMARGILNSIAIDSEGEDYSFQTFQLSGVKDVIDSTCNMLSAITEIPQTILFGRSPAGMSATGESDLENYYNYVDKIRKLMLRHNLLRIIDLICQAKYRCGQFEEIPHYKLTFSPLWSLSETEQAQVDQVKAATAQTKAATAQLYIDMGALDPSEVRSGLKSSEDYVIEDLVDENSPDMTDAEMQTLMQGVMGAEQQEAASPSLPQTNADGTPKGAVGVLVIKGGEILCGERRDGQGICGPGGHIEEGETPREAAARETWEEFGITPTELICVGQLTELPPQYGKPYIFLSTAYTGEINPNTPEMQNSAFAKLPSLHSANLFLPFRESLDFLLAQLDGDNSIGEFSENSIDKQSFSDIIKPRSKSSILPENALSCRENSAFLQTTETDEFKESDHPRDKNGQFTSGSQGNSKRSSPNKNKGKKNPAPAPKQLQVTKSKVGEHASKDYQRRCLAALKGVKTSDGRQVNGIHDHAMFKMQQRDVYPHNAALAISMGKPSPGNKPHRILYEYNGTSVIYDEVGKMIVSCVYKGKDKKKEKRRK